MSELHQVLISVLSSIGDNSAEEETETAETEIPDGLPEMDLEGYNYVMCINGNEERVEQTYVEELNGEIINDAVYNRNVKIEEA